ncbi:hypothetical protein LCGC14_2111520 [marine sediment metagenome]|uniref:Phage portal protein n=1 Tax=marine sediment metagenome TaxID=412755 RepID=A0A0F9EU49_9ZZZZ
MALLTATDLFNMRVSLGAQLNAGQITNEALLAHLIISDKASDRKGEMINGMNYYAVNQEIKNKKREYVVEGKKITDALASNHKLAHGFHKIIVDQKVGYIAGKPIQITAKDPKNAEQIKFQTETEDAVGDQFNDTMATWIKGTSNKGEEFLHPFINSDGDFDYITVGAEQCIPIYDSRYNKQMVSMIRYYNVEKINEKGIGETLIAVEWWDEMQVTFYIEQKPNTGTNRTSKTTFILDMSESNLGNPRPHFFKGNTNEPDEPGEAGSWERVPFVRLLNNDEGYSDLRYYKSLIDSYDFVESDLIDKIEDIADAIWKITGIEGDTPSELRKNLKEFKILLLPEDADATSETLEIPIEAVDKSLDRLCDDIFLFAMAVNIKTEKLGTSVSGVALKVLYTLLDLKANVLISKCKLALRDFLYFVAFWIKLMGGDEFDYKTLVFTFDKSIIINEQEKIQNLAISGRIISEQTKTEEHPYAKANEAERLEAEKGEFEDEFNVDEGDE